MENLQQIMRNEFPKFKQACLPICPPKRWVRRGFSMLELLIVLAIMVLMTGVVFVNRNSSKAAADVEMVARQVAAQIRALQNESLSGKQIGTNYVSRYYLGITNGTSTYTVSYKDSAGIDIVGGSQTVNLSKKRVSFSWAAGGPSLYFVAPHGQIDSVKSIVITSMIDTNVKNWVCVSINGNVTEQKTDC
jgi:prepilin-type N-terminal cleavage/methylation domain-containing protein